MKNEDLIKLSIIIPYYDRPKYIKRLLEVLEPQLTNETELIIVDDCSPIPLDYPCIRLNENSGGASIPRNVGLDRAKGKYIAFIDSDDLISNDYISTILEKIKEEWDYCFISWKTSTNTIIIKDNPPNWNCCVWNCIYKKEIIGNERFNPNLRIAEDYDFNIRVRKGKKANIEKVLYYYNETSKSIMRPNIEEQL